jgi:hypothetical protein
MVHKVQHHAFTELITKAYEWVQSLQIVMGMVEQVSNF